MINAGTLTSPAVMPSRLRRRLAATMAASQPKKKKKGTGKAVKQPNWYAPYRGREEFLFTAFKRAVSGQTTMIREVRHKNDAMLHRNIIKATLIGRIRAVGLDPDDFVVGVARLGDSLLIRLGRKGKVPALPIPQTWLAQRKLLDHVR